MQDDKVTSASFTGPLAALLDERQYEAGFGPCMDAATSGAVVRIDDTTDSEGYTDFGRTAHRHGVTHSISIPLPVERRTIGALNVYATAGEPFDRTTEELATAFAGYAAVAVANAGVYASTVNLVGHLQRALESRGVIDQAKGILMARLGVSADAAFDLLAQQSQTRNRKLHDIARDVVASTRSPREG
jgi:GAF domain-containing protein